MKKLNLLFVLFAFSFFAKAVPVDTTPPSITGFLIPINVVGCNAVAAPAACATVACLETMGLAISDNVTTDANIMVMYSDVSIGTCPIMVNRTYTLIDEANNQAIVTQIINVEDPVAPTVTGALTNVTIEGCSAASAPTAVTTVSALQGMGLSISDNCTLTPSLIVSSTQTVSGICPIVIDRTYSIQDFCGNVTTVSQVITIDDTTIPSLTTPITEYPAVNAGGGTYQIPDLTSVVRGIAIDNCTPTSNLTIVQTPPAAMTITSNTNVYVTISDACGNSIPSPLIINVQIPTNDKNTENSAGSVYAADGGIIVKGCLNESVQIADINGVVVFAGKITSDEQLISVSDKAVYMVNVKGKTIKVLVK